MILAEFQNPAYDLSDCDCNQLDWLLHCNHHFVNDRNNLIGMNKNYLVGVAVIAVFVLMFDQFPSNVTDPNSAVIDARQGIVTDTVVSTGEKGTHSRHFAHARDVLPSLPSDPAPGSSTQYGM